MAIENHAIGSTNTTVYTSNGNNAITTIIVCNTAAFDPADPTSEETKLYLYAVPNGVSPVTSTQLIINGLPVPAGETVSLDQEKMVLSNGDTIVAKSDAPTNLVVTVSTLPV
jgi:hypothetical protein